MLKVDDAFPSFSLEDQDGILHSSADLVGQRFVVYFYPKDDTPGCTTQACGLRDLYAELRGLRVFGVSPDSVKSHKKFADKFSLPFPILSDSEKSLCQACGVWVEKSMYGKKYMGVARTTFVVNSEGRVIEVWEGVDVKSHARRIADLLTSK